jgi:hypothetical protein
MITGNRGGKSSKNRRDSVVEIQNHIGDALELQESEWKRKRRPRVLRGTQPSLYIPGNSKAGYVRARGRTCSVKTGLIVPEKKNQKPPEKPIIDGYGVGPIVVHICHRWTCFENQNVHMA